MRLSKDQRYYHMMVAPGILLLVVFSYIPLYGIIMAFQNYRVTRGIWNSPFVGLRNFRNLLLMSGFRQAVLNTLVISVSKIVLSILIPVLFALVLNECKSSRIKRFVQTVCYLPHFLSWVILGVVFTSFFSLSGLFNQFISLFGVKPEIWLVKANSFRSLLIWSDIWKSFGYSAIIYLATLASINPQIYESADIDGASRLQRIWYITLPSLLPTIVLMATLSLRGILDGGFDQVFNLYSELVYSTGDIIDTYIYRIGLVELKYSLSSAVSLIKSVVSMVLILISYSLARHFADYNIF